MSIVRSLKQIFECLDGFLQSALSMEEYAATKPQLGIEWELIEPLGARRNRRVVFALSLFTMDEKCIRLSEVRLARTGYRDRFRHFVGSRSVARSVPTMILPTNPPASAAFLKSAAVKAPPGTL